MTKRKPTADEATQKNRPKEYRGPLSPASVANGINAAQRNARRLASDALLLLQAGRYPTAASLAALSIEESGKASILRGIAVLTAPDELSAAWRNYRDHRSKNGAWILPFLAAQGARHLDEFSEIVDREADHTQLLNSIKQIGLYTDCFGNAHWSEPSIVISDDLAQMLVEISGILAKGQDVSVREIELWVKHLAPVWKTIEMSHALVRWAAEMELEGSGGRSEADYARFIFGDGRDGKRAKEPNRQ
jgi:AbiV family abortive infection protein